jgi:hypothetical protein
VQNTSLRVLNLDWNGLEDEGCQFLGTILTSNRALAELRLNHTRCGPAGSLLLAEGLLRNVTLERLELRGNPIGDDGGRHLLTAPQKNKVLLTIRMEGSNFSIKSGGQERFNFRSPEGHYKLNLANPVDRAVASQLCALEERSAAAQLAQNLQPRLNRSLTSKITTETDAKEPTLKRSATTSRLLDKADTPETITTVAKVVSCWRGVKLNGRPVNGSPLAKKWPEKMPTKGELEFDYVAFRGGHTEITPLDEEDLEDLCGQLSSATVSDFERLSLTRLFAASCYFRSRQVKPHDTFL